MELNEELISKIKSTDNEKLRTDIKNVLKSMGLEENMFDFYLKDMDKIKAALGNITQKDLDGIEKKIGTEEMQKFVSAINDGLN